MATQHLTALLEQRKMPDSMGESQEVAFSVKEDLFKTNSVSNVVTRLFWEAIYFILLPVEPVRWVAIRFAILPSIAMLSKKSVDQLREMSWRRIQDDSFEGQEFNRVAIKTVDGVKLDTLEIRHPDQTVKKPEEQKWILFFHGNGASTEGMLDGLAKLSKDTGASVYTGNYRGVGYSEGFPWRSSDLVLDGEAMVQYLLSKGVKTENILIHGWSMGGGVSTAVAAKHPGIHLCNDRSFSTLSREVREFLGKALGDVIGIIAAAIVRFIDWDFDSVNNYDRVTGEKFMMDHPCDGLILHRGGLYYEKKQKQMTPEDRKAKRVRSALKAQGRPFDRKYAQDYKPKERIRLESIWENWTELDGTERIRAKEREIELSGQGHHCTFIATPGVYTEGYRDYLDRVRHALKL